jgi:hypothetical protein
VRAGSAFSQDWAYADTVCRFVELYHRICRS